jgi:cbb3-type cytochrome oxidase maturation protein
MSVIILLLAASLSVALVFLGAFIWSVRNRQFDDDYSPPQRILFDDVPRLTDTDPDAASDGGLSVLTSPKSLN